nr:Bmrp [Starmerella bombicola]
MNLNVGVPSSSPPTSMSEESLRPSSNHVGSQFGGNNSELADSANNGYLLRATAEEPTGATLDDPVIVVRKDGGQIVGNGHKEMPMAQFVEDIGAEVDIEIEENGKLIRKRLPGVLRKNGRREIREKDCYNKLGFSFPWYKKWTILTVIFWVQMSMNFNTSVYPNGITLISEDKGISMQKARVSQMLFLVTYAFGCELWAPWSEEFGRWPVMQLSLFFVNVWQILGALAPNFASICVARALGGFSSAGGSVTLGMVADMWEANDQGYAVAYIVLSSVGGTSIGPVFGGIMQDQLNWHWNFWIQLIFGGVVELCHFFLVCETRATILMDREARRRRKSGEDLNIYGPNEIKPKRIDIKEFMYIWKRPFVMFLTEPIIGCLSLLSGFSDALIFIAMDSTQLTYQQYGWGATACGLIYVAILVGYLCAWLIHLPDVWRQIHVMNKYGESARFSERRMLLLLFLAPLEPIGLFIYGWTGLGPGYGIPWIAPTIGLWLIAIANYSIYMSTIDYMIASYGPFSASATGANGFARDFLAGISTMYASPMYDNIGDKFHLAWASTLLGCIAIMVAIPIYVFYWKGPLIRKRSKFAQALAADKKFEHREDDTLETASSDLTGEEKIASSS